MRTERDRARFVTDVFVVKDARESAVLLSTTRQGGSKRKVLVAKVAV